jgi:glycosyltransferase involved in cell wall biosynthesis
MIEDMPRTRVLLISHDVIGRAMAGPGIRYAQLARQLAPHVDLTLAVRVDASESLPPIDFGVATVDVVGYQRDDWASLAPAAAVSDVIILPSDTATEFPQLADLPAALVIDGYDPLLAEWLALFSDMPEPERGAAWQARMAQLHVQYRMGDLFICASERQRYWWLGQLEAAGRLHPATFAAVHALHNLVAVVPYGLPTDPPVPRAPVVRGVWPGIEQEDKLLLWGGGLWPWLDPVTAIRAVGRIWTERQDVKLIFPGTRHPNPIMQAMPTRNAAAFACADELGLRDQAVFFGDWVDYELWPSLLLECDAALTLHFDTVETQLAFRSRLFDYIWAGLPTVASRGDATSDLVLRYDLGRLVDYEDDAAVADALMTLLEEDEAARAEAFAAARSDLTWARAAAPLVEFCRNPRRAPDRPAGLTPVTPYFQAREAALAAQLDRAETRIAELEALVQGYADGRVMRALDGVTRWRNRLLGGDRE